MAFDGSKIKQTNMVVLYIDGTRPDQLSTIIISNSGKNKFKGQPEVDYKGRDLIVTGKLVTYNGKLQL